MAANVNAPISLDGATANGDGKKRRRPDPSHRRSSLWAIFFLASMGVCTLILHMSLELTNDPHGSTRINVDKKQPVGDLNTSRKKDGTGGSTSGAMGKESMLDNFERSMKSSPQDEHKNNDNSSVRTQNEAVPNQVPQKPIVKGAKFIKPSVAKRSPHLNINNPHAGPLPGFSHPRQASIGYRLKQPQNPGLDKNDLDDLSKPQSTDELNKNQTKISVQPLIERSNKVEVPDKQRIITFVHIGKSGGSTISSLLRNGCMDSIKGKPCEERRWERFPGPTGRVESMASQRIQFYLHTPHAEEGPEKMAEYYERVTSIVAVARDPLERFISAFLTRHPDNIDATRMRNKRARLIAEMQGKPEPLWAKAVWPSSSDQGKNEMHRVAFGGCYPTVEEFAFCADQPSGYKVYNTTVQWWQKNKWNFMNVSLDCSEICRDVAMQKSDFVHHARWGYQAFLGPLPLTKEVFVIRTKFLWEDWITVNNMLGSTYDVPVPSHGDAAHVINARGTLPVRNNISKVGKKILCRYLKEEIRVYISLLNRAINLSDGDVRVTLEGLLKTCPEVVESLINEAALNLK